MILNTKDSNKMQQWLKRDDIKLMEFVEKHGATDWTTIAQQFGRSAKFCSKRWHNKLNPLIKRSNWTTEEECLLFLLHSIFGSHWPNISYFFGTGRSKNAVKNYWHNQLKCKQHDMKRKLEKRHSLFIRDNNSGF